MNALSPENELEARFFDEPDFLTGLTWGVPRYGHPEGEIYKHVQEVLINIDSCGVDDTIRQQLRFIAFTHDTFKYKEHKGEPRDWSRHHGVYARLFLERFITDWAVLNVTELHDEAYYAWRLSYLYQQPAVGKKRLERLLDRIGKYIQLYYIFFKCDTKTGDKNQAPLKWFEATIPGIEIISF